jgi:hypothetical protein
VGPLGQPVAVELGGHDRFDPAAEIGYGTCEYLIRAIGQAGQAGNVACLGRDRLTDGCPVTRGALVTVFPGEALSKEDPPAAELANLCALSQGIISGRLAS